MITHISPFMLNSLFHLCFVKYSLWLEKEVIIKRVTGMLKIIFPAHSNWVGRVICLGMISPAFLSWALIWNACFHHFHCRLHLKNCVTVAIIIKLEIKLCTSLISCLSKFRWLKNTRNIWMGSGLTLYWKRRKQMLRWFWLLQSVGIVRDVWAQVTCCSQRCETSVTPKALTLFSQTLPASQGSPDTPSREMS